MLKNKHTLLLVLLLIPTVAFAHGEEVLLTLLIIPVSIILFLLAGFAFKIKTAIRRGILFAFYFFTLFLIFILTAYIPYRENMLLINASLAFAPPMVAAFAYFLSGIFIKEKG